MMPFAAYTAAQLPMPVDGSDNRTTPEIAPSHVGSRDVKRGQMLEAEAEAKFLASRPVWPRCFNTTGIYTSGTGHIIHSTA